MDTTKLTIGIGSLQPAIGKQLKQQGFKFDKEKVKHFDKLVDCITHLRFSGILPESQIKKAHQTLFNKIQAHVKIKNKPSNEK